MATFLYKPDWQAKNKKTPRVNTVQFGDGYEARGTDGLNTNLDTWNLSFVRDPDTVEEIEGFLSEMNGVQAFNWTTPGGKVAAFKCAEWEPSYDSPGWTTLTATFKEVPEPLAGISGDASIITTNNPPPRALCRSVSDGKHIYILGGFVSEGVSHKELWRYDIISNVWTQLSNALDNITPASGQQCYAPAGSAVIYNNKIYVPGQHYNIKTDTWTNTDPHLFGVGCPWFGSGNYVYSHAPAGGTQLMLNSGGTLLRSGSTYATLHITQPESMSKLNLSDNTIMSNLTKDVLSGAGSGSVVGTTPFLFGGSGATGRTGALRSYNVSSNTWNTKASGPDSRSSHAACVQGNNLYVQGGYNGANLSDLWNYKVGSNIWKQIFAADLPALNRHSIISAGGCLYVFGGTTNSDSALPNSNLSNTLYRIS